MLEEMPSRLLTEWMVFYQLEPFGERRADLRAAMVQATVANRHRNKGEKVYKAADFMPKLGDDEDEQAPDWETLLDRVKAINAAFGGEDRTQ